MKIIQYTLAMVFTLLAFQLQAAEGVARAAFTTAIDDREPIDEVSTLDTDASKVYYFTEIKGLKGQTITHRWEQNGEVQATVSFDIGGDRWRIWSSKNLDPEFTGQWQVMVLDEAGNVLSQNSFDYGQAESTPSEAISDADASPSRAMENMAEKATATESKATATAQKAPAEKAMTEKAITEKAAVKAEQTTKTAGTMSEEELSKIAPAAGKPAMPAKAPAAGQ